MWPNQLHFLCFIVRRMFLPFLNICNTFLFFILTFQPIFETIHLIRNIWFYFSYNFYLKFFITQEDFRAISSTYFGVHIKCLNFCSIKSADAFCNRSDRVVLCGRTERGMGRHDETKSRSLQRLKRAYRNDMAQ